MSNEKRKVNYRISWESEFNWIKKDQQEGHAYCKVCKTSIRIDNSGISQVRRHATSKSHQEKDKLLSGMTKQRVLVTQKDSRIGLSQESSSFSFSEQVLNAEIVEALDVVDSNYSFSSTNGNSDKIKRQFPDSKIAASFKQGETKTK